MEKPVKPASPAPSTRDRIPTPRATAWRTSRSNPPAVALSRAAASCGLHHAQPSRTRAPLWHVKHHVVRA